MSIVEETNKTFLSKLNAQRDELIRRGENYPNHIDKSDNGTAFIRPEDEEKYDAINELKGYLEFKAYDPQTTYILPGVEIENVNNENGKPLRMSIAIQEKDISKILDKIDKFKKLGIKFPAQLYQFKYKEQPLPGKTYKAPRPMLIEETEEQYEAFLKGYYEQNGEHQELIGDGTESRKPYPHEKIPYDKGYKIDKKYLSEYYESYLDEVIKKSTRQPSPGASNNRAQSGKPYTFKESTKGEKLPLLQGAGTFINGIRTNLANGSTGSKVKTVAGIAFIMGVGGVALTSGYLVPAALIGGIGFASYKVFRYLSEKIKNKADELLYGKKMPPATQPGGDGDGSSSGHSGDDTGGSQGGSGQGSGQPPQGDDDFNMKIEGLLTELGINAEDYKTTTDQIKTIEDNLNNLDPTSAEYKIQMEKLSAAKARKKRILQVVVQQLEEYGKNPQVQQTGGPHL